MNFENLFDGIFCSAEMGLKKPEKEYYESIINTLGVDPSNIIYYDDALENIESARSLGIDARLYTDRESFTHIS
jgi:HAD superfamily hydrolase (TIGR01509 family)